VNVGYPFHFQPWHRSAEDDDDAHIRDMIEQVLFTVPGERVNRPDFGCGLRQYVFAPNGPQVEAALQVVVRSALQRWLGDVLVVQELEVLREDAALRVVLDYVVRSSGQSRRDVLTAGEA
jgi:phage baseplate assembly protein W